MALISLDMIIIKSCDLISINNTISRDKLEPTAIQIVSEMEEIHKAIILLLEEHPSGEVILFNRDKAINSFPILCYATTEINVFMSKYLTGACKANGKV